MKIISCYQWHTHETRTTKLTQGLPELICLLDFGHIVIWMNVNSKMVHVCLVMKTVS